ncbi:MAG: SUKH-4 family immunity protein [Lachnospiraceae bacterium]|nr:SUKH-4 family immunity protein [Lachnospiraceae bacterium]
MTAKEFLERWDTEICPMVSYDAKKIHALNLPEDVKDFLIEAGLPSDAAPFLNFESSAKKGATKLGLFGKKRKYIYFGYTEAGDKICVLEETGHVLCINHEDGSEIFINSSILKLAECLLAYSEFIDEINKVNGRRAFLEGIATEEQLEKITSRLNNIDGNALNDKSFWMEELQHYRK